MYVFVERDGLIYGTMMNTLTERRILLVFNAMSFYKWKEQARVRVK